MKTNKTFINKKKKQKKTEQQSKRRKMLFFSLIESYLEWSFYQ